MLGNEDLQSCAVIWQVLSVPVLIPAPPAPYPMSKPRKSLAKTCRHGVRDAVAQGLSLVGVTGPRRRHRDHLLIVTFHRVLTAAQRAEYPLPGLAVTPAELEWFLAYFARHYDCRSLSEGYAAWRAEAPRTDRRPLAVVTFDDGQRDNFEHAVPALNRAGIPGCFYLPTDHVDSGAAIWHDRWGFAVQALQADAAAQQALGARLRERDLPQLATALSQGTGPLTRALKSLSPAERSTCVELIEEVLGGSQVPEWSAMMNWDQARSTRAQGHEIGSHSRSHAILPQLEDAALEDELRGSKQRLEDELEAEIDTICYPDGACDGRVAAAAAAAGYRVGVTTREGSNAASEEPLQLRRFDLNAFNCRDLRGRMSGSLLAFRISGMFPGLG